MVEKMVYVNITGHINDLDRVVEKYLSKYDVQLENSFSELENINGIISFNVTNPYSNIQRKAERLIQIAGLKAEGTYELDKERAMEVIETANEYYNKRDSSVKSLEVKREIYRDFIATLGHFEGNDFHMEQLAKFKFIKIRFGRMPVSSYKQFENYLYDSTDIIIFPGKEEEDYVYVCYFVPESLKDKADSIFSSLHFERIWISDNLDGVRMTGTPVEILQVAREKLIALDKEIRELLTLKMADINLTSDELISAYAKVKELSFNYETRKHAARTRRDYFIFVGWMSKSDAEKLEKELEQDEKVVFIIEQESKAIKSKPPTRLKNMPLVKPFEFFVRMYGLPTYGEVDPTPFVAFTYTLIFGLMFGDLGQGAVLSLLGLYLNEVKKMELGSVMSIIGLSSMFFGLMYGSVFGIEELIPALWIKPSHSINQILAVTVGLGVFLIIVAMLINIYNAAKKKDWTKMILNPNGVIGLVFYVAIVFTALSAYMGNKVAEIVIFAFIVLPVLLLAFREPIINKIKGKKHFSHGGIGQFLLETVIELFEVMLSYFTNTISFVRIGAFALSHAGMMSVVLLLARTPTDSLNPIVMIIGNIFVIAMEGLVVGIQVLRLEFYEMFSRFFNGDGREFKSHKNLR